jgi:hypothetical protein
MLASPALGKRSRMMVRRNRRKFVLSALIASALQIFAPGWAVMAMAARYFDPIAIAPVCSEHPKLDGNSAARHGHEPVSIGDILRQSPGISVKQSANC